ncbi:Jouberin [Phytophthora pseudosyringae]|uniref:Jouberin n=1 Tax=Phytophthora pseudosyringae TaxID=221518 RepID=A0A8T1V9H6_9STRA|nr:Jouberin [Phytophthora pseudosyringae]
MGKKALKLDSPADGTSAGASKKKPSPRTKGRPRKSLMRQHRKESLQAELAEEPQSPQAESPLLKTVGEVTQPPSSKGEKPSRRTTRLPSASLPRPKRAGKGNNNNENNDNADTHQNEQSSIPTARRSSFMSWRSRNSTATIVEDTPPASCPLSCQPSACFIGSLNGTISEMHLPLLTKQTKARMNALKGAPKQRQLEVTIERSDELPFGAYSHPQVHVHIVDRCTGRALCPTQMTSEAKFYAASNNNANCTNAFEWQQALGVSVDMPTFLNTRTLLLFEILETKPPTKGMRFRRGKRFESVSTHDEDDEYQKSFKSPSTPEYRRIAWGFFHTITNKGTPTMDSFVLPDVPDPNENERKKKQSIVDVCGLRVRLFEYHVMTWMDSYQAKLQWGWRKNHPTVPAVFLQYQRRSRVPAPSTLHVQLRAVNPAASPRQTGIPETTETTASSGVADIGDENGNNAAVASENGTGDNQEPQTEVSAPPGVEEKAGKPATPEAASSELFDLTAPCKRNASEPCLIPQRILCSLPTGKKGCSAVSFSPCGHFLAASVSPELGDFVVRVYNMTSAELFAVGRGHRGVIYSLEWSIQLNGQYRLLSASSDGTARLWELPSKNGSSPPVSPQESGSRRSRLLPLVFQWHHFPCFVYCAKFLPGSNGEIVFTAASDGCMRFRKESSVPQGQPEFGLVQVSSAAVHTICVEAKSGRIFCGDAKGNVTVWRRTANASTLSDYERIKTIQTGQSSITSLELHPRKAHLLVHTQPNALFQYELRSYLLLNKSYAGVACESLLLKSAFSPDGKLVISGSEDGFPRLFTSLHGQQLQRGVWGTHFFHGCPVLDVSWSPTAHMAALCSYGGNNPIVVLCSYRDDKEAAYIDDSAPNTTANLQQVAVDAFRGTNQQEALSGDHVQRLQRALERRQKRLQAKLSLETEASKGSTNTVPASSVAV